MKDRDFKRLRNLLGELKDLQSAMALLEWDQQIYLPAGAEETRAHQMETLAGVIHRKATSAQLGRLLDQLEQVEYDPDSFESALLREERRNFDHSAKVPASLVAALSRATATAHGLWLKAREAADFSLLANSLRRIVELKQRYAALFGGFACSYDALLDHYEPGITSAEIDAIFAPLRVEQTALVREAASRPAPDDSFLKGRFPAAAQLKISRYVVQKLGYDFNHGRIDLTAHPFSTNIGLADVRITTAVDEALPVSCLLSTIHECGHALYELGIDPRYDRTSLGQGLSYGFHESQSRFWENIIGRSESFWRWLYPRFQRSFRARLEGVPLETFLAAIRRVEPNEIRTEADEATYNLHIMLRYELEKALFAGTLRVEDLPEAWSAKMTEYLGVTPRNDRYGVLQDIHWPLGDFGYFPTYALGNLISVQIFETARQAIPDLESQIERGQFGILREFLRNEVHQYGARYTRRELLTQLTGSPEIDARPYLNYLRRRYLPDVQSLRTEKNR